jgi:hypothetical protein
MLDHMLSCHDLQHQNRNLHFHEIRESNIPSNICEKYGLMDIGKAVSAYACS